MGSDDRHGILYPGRLPSFHREPAPPHVAELVRWIWIPRWRLAPGATSRQEVLPFPASNLVIDPDGVTLVGPSSRASHRELSGEGWAVGALLRPAGIGALLPDPRTIRDGVIALDAPDLHDAVVSAMRIDDDAGRRRAAHAVGEWAIEHMSRPDANGALANRMEDVIASDRTIVRVEQVARRLGISIRGVQRLAAAYVGLPPLAVIRRYRLQEAAHRLSQDRSATVAQVAADLGYADHAHLDADFRRTLGESPTSYRRESDAAG